MTSARVRTLTFYAFCGATLLQVVAVAQTKDPLLGRWVLNRARSAFKLTAVSDFLRAMTLEMELDRRSHGDC